MEYHKIETLYQRDAISFKVKEGILKNSVYSLLKQWECTEKIDGTNMRIIWQNGKMSFGGKTDRAQLHSDLIEWLYDRITPEKLREIFQEEDAVIYGEGCGDGIQKGKIYGSTKKLVVFDILVARKWWLNWQNVCDVSQKLQLETVPYLGLMTLEEAVEKTKKGFKTALGDGSGNAEGLIGKPQESLFNKKGERIIFKIKTRDF